MIIYSNQKALFGKAEIIGYAKNNICVKEVQRSKANQIIRENHYSKKTYNNSYIHLGFYVQDDLHGILQLGHPMNIHSISKIVPTTNKENFLELNRMWIDDRSIKYAESQAISLCIKYIKRKFPKVKWIQSFADERCEKLGIVYQASNFDYYGEHLGIFFEIDGEFYHEVHKYSRTLGSQSSYAKLNKEGNEVIKHKIRQFRYIFWVDKRLKQKCTLKQHDYPKHYK